MTTQRGGREPPALQHGPMALTRLGDERVALDAAKMANLAGLSRSTAHRQASAFVRVGYLQRDHTRKYRVAPGATDPGAEIIGEIRRALSARDALETLRDKSGYTVSMGTLDGTRVTYVHRLFGHQRGHHTVDRELRVGAHVPAYCTALGKVMLASLSNAERRERVATIQLVPQGPRSITAHNTLLTELDDMNLRAPTVSDEEFVIGARSIAMLISRSGGEQPIAIDVTVPSAAYTTAQLLRQVGPSVMHAARSISEAGARPQRCRP